MPTDRRPIYDPTKIRAQHVEHLVRQSLSQSRSAFSSFTRVGGNASWSQGGVDAPALQFLYLSRPILNGLPIPLIAHSHPIQAPVGPGLHLLASFLILR